MSVAATASSPKKRQVSACRRQLSQLPLNLLQLPQIPAHAQNAGRCRVTQDLEERARIMKMRINSYRKTGGGFAFCTSPPPQCTPLQDCLTPRFPTRRELDRATATSSAIFMSGATRESGTWAVDCVCVYEVSPPWLTRLVIRSLQK